MRAKFTEVTSKASWTGCHATINPLGFSLGNFDAVGRVGTTDNSKPVNASADYISSDGETAKLNGPRDLAQGFHIRNLHIESAVIAATRK